MNAFNVNALLNQVSGELLDATLGEETAAAAGDLSSLIENFDPMRFLENLSYMGVGMLGIFIVMGTLIVGTALLNKVTSRKKKD